MLVPTPEKAFYFQWHFLQRCNLRCSHCYQENYHASELEEIQLFKIADVLENTLKKWKRSGRVSLTGGEPFLRKDLLLKLLNFFENSDAFYWTGILSNGTLVDNDIATQMKQFKKLKEIQISLDGASAPSHDQLRGSGSFDKAVNSIKLLKEFGFTVSVMFTLHKRNREEALKMIRLSEQLNLDFLTIERIVPYSKEDIEQFYLPPLELKEIYQSIYILKKDVEKRGNLKIRVSRPLWGLIDNQLGGFCPAGFSSLSILHDGTVLPCRRLEVPIGNVLQDGLFKIWYTSDVLWKLRNKNLNGEKCKSCELLGNCGGCRAIAHTMTGDFQADDPQCWKNMDI
jgi:radical SAM protein with 4Fe4S-binding SPASM domain